MSAYIMDHQQINKIIGYFVDVARSHDQVWASINGEYKYVTRSNAAEVGQLLYAQNVRSVDTRYNEENDSRYLYQFIGRDKTTPQEVVELLSSYDYQACETDDYYTTEAFYLIARMRKTLLDEIYAEEPDYAAIAAYTN